MVCLKCGKELPDDAKFCDACGAEIKADENAVTVEEAVTEPKKKGKTLTKVLIAIVAVITILGATTALAFPYVKNFVAKTFLSDEGYFEAIEFDNIDEMAENIASVMGLVKKESGNFTKNYEKLLNGNFNATDERLDGKKIETEMSLTFGKPIISVLNDMTYMDLSVFEKIALSVDSSYKGEKSQGKLALGLSDKNIITVDAIALNDGKAYISLPELSKKAMEIDLPKFMGYDDLSEIYSSEEYTTAMEQLEKILHALPDEKTVDKIISKYSRTVLSEIDDIDISKAKLTAGELKLNALAIEATIDEDDLEDIVVALVEKFEHDEELWDVLAEIAASTGEMTKSEFKEALREETDFDGFEEEIEGEFYGFGEIKFTTYVNAKGDVLARKIKYMDYTLDIICLEKGNKVAFEITLDSNETSFSLKGNGSKKKNIFNGTVSLEAMGIDIVTVEAKDFDTENFFNGTLTIKPSKTVSAMISSYDAEELEYTLGFNVNDYGIDLSDLALVINMKGDEKSALLSLDFMSGRTSVIRLETKVNEKKADDIIIPEDTIKIQEESDFEEWLLTFDLEGFMEKLPEEVKNIITLIVESGMLESPSIDDGYYYDDGYYLDYEYEGSDWDIEWDEDYSFDDEYDLNYEDYISDFDFEESII